MGTLWDISRVRACSKYHSCCLMQGWHRSLLFRARTSFSLSPILAFLLVPYSGHLLGDFFVRFGTPETGSSGDVPNRLYHALTKRTSTLKSLHLYRSKNVRNTSAFRLAECPRSNRRCPMTLVLVSATPIEITQGKRPGVRGEWN